MNKELEHPECRPMDNAYIAELARRIDEFLQNHSDYEEDEKIEIIDVIES